MNNYPQYSADALREAADIVDKIEELHAQLAATLSSGETATPVRRGPGRPKGAGAKKKSAKGAKRKISPEGIERIRAAQKARWAKTKKGK